MNKYFLALLFLSTTAFAENNFLTADNALIQYTGRIDFSNVKKPRFWAAGVYIQAAFEGTSLEISINDEMLWGISHNYLEIIIDNLSPYKIQTSGKSNRLTIAEGLPKGKHVVTICKNTEALIGYLEFVGFWCDALLPLPERPFRKMEFIGDSITSGMGNDLSPIPCDTRQWYDQHNAYFSYGPLVARQLNAQWHLTSESGIGLIHSCCNKTFTMPELVDKVSISKDSLLWNFKNYQPDVVTICLGQNDGIQDSSKFCSAYVKFMISLRNRYPNAMMICLSSPMANEALRTAMKNYLTGVVNYLQKHGDKNTARYFFSKGFNKGCGGHPDLADHQEIAKELSAFIGKKMKWN